MYRTIVFALRGSATEITLPEPNATAEQGEGSPREDPADDGHSCLPPFNIQKEFVKCSGSSVPEEKVLANLYSKIGHYNCHKITLEVTDVAIKATIRSEKRKFSK